MWQTTLPVLLGLVGFGLVHSAMAAHPVKRRAKKLLGPRAYEGWYRLLYTLVSLVTFAPLVLWIATHPGPVLWRTNGALTWALNVARALSLVALYLAGRSFDLWRFIGVRQARAWLNGEPLPLPPEPFVQHGMYGLVRHPIYLFSAIYLWAQPTMRAASFALALGATVYFLVGGWLEEERMARELGSVYAAYRQRVPFIVPFWRGPRSFLKAINARSDTR